MTLDRILAISALRDSLDVRSTTGICITSLIGAGFDLQLLESTLPKKASPLKGDVATV